jgi:hypothetical protein
LGLTADLQSSDSKGEVTFWAKDAFVQKVVASIREALAEHRLTSGQAAKLYGRTGFLSEGSFGRVGRAGLARLKERQLCSDKTTTITAELGAALDFIMDVISMSPKRTVHVGNIRHRRFVAASDAAQDNGGRPSGGFLVETNGGVRRGALVYCTPCLRLWSPEGTKIAQLELLQIVAGLTIMPEVFRDASGVWFIDNLAALYSLVKGRSDSPELDHMASIAHSLLFGLNCCMFFEWIESKSNWADSLSRCGHSDPWHRAHGFRVHDASVPLFMWSMPWKALMTMSQYL